GMSITAEGVETANLLELVRAAGCTDAQGFLIGRPGPASNIKSPGAQKRISSAA
ncbi:MAG: EAL domain-containing protein, partial [Pseudaminobacter sp.]|nr:EAL domain-containing protein [Pseudaminobacter sp.]